MLIGLSGKFCAGKDEIAKYLVKRYGFERRAFADKLKAIATDLFGMNGKDRSLLQVFGAKMREINPDVWVRHVLRSLTGYENVVITDVRYSNEYQAIRQINQSVLIRVECPADVRMDRHQELYGDLPTGKQIYHRSETDLDTFDFDRCIDTNQGLQMLHNDIDSMMESYESFWWHKQPDSGCKENVCRETLSVQSRSI
jgi:hypothetical protein